jgi:hypothetical protein
MKYLKPYNDFTAESLLLESSVDFNLDMILAQLPNSTSEWIHLGVDGISVCLLYKLLFLKMS